MIKILLYSRNTRNTDKIKEILENKDFTVRAQKVFKTLPPQSDDTRLIILDITSKDTGDDIHLNNIILTCFM